MNHIPQSFSATYGDIFDINSREKSDIGRDDQISCHLLDRAREASELAFKNGGYKQLRVSSAYLPSLDPRAFAYWSTRSPNDYVIACNRGTCEVIRHALNNAEVRSLLPAKIKALRKLHVDDLEDLTVSLTLATILYHEVAHVNRFHLPYLAECKENSPESLPSARGLCEADADKWASFIIAPDLMAQAEGIHRTLMLSSPVEATLREVLTLYGIGLHVWFSFFNQKDFPISSIYPHPLIRSTRITIGAADNIPGESASDSIVLDRALAVLDGLSAVEQSMERLQDSNQHPFDLTSEMNAINEKFTGIEKTLNSGLIDVTSRWGSPRKGVSKKRGQDS
ncbi:MAG TPA: hypothetical protein ENJ84_00965 [Gammaproteobacteria bacterium]|nr:hypothetical protein [Gammaproteobacteria bacterium]